MIVLAWILFGLAALRLVGGIFEGGWDGTDDDVTDTVPIALALLAIFLLLAGRLG